MLKEHEHKTAEAIQQQTALEARFVCHESWLIWRSSTGSTLVAEEVLAGGRSILSV
jgi:hypothetical protein